MHMICLLIDVCLLHRDSSGGESFLFKAKLFVMVFLMLLDIGLNSSVEHEAVDLCEGDFRDGTILAIILG